ncbi:MAG TPA: hypothetical protein VF158_10115 [Longimicrobiales bacterium]
MPYVHGDIRFIPLVSVVALLIGCLAVAAAIAGRRRIRSRLGDGGLDDAQIRQIETHGWLEVEDPLDWEEIRTAERRFWEETWDEPDGW